MNCMRAPCSAVSCVPAACPASGTSSAVALGAGAGGTRGRAGCWCASVGTVFPSGRLLVSVPLASGPPRGCLEPGVRGASLHPSRAKATLPSGTRPRRHPQAPVQSLPHPSLHAPSPAHSRDSSAPTRVLWVTRVTVREGDRARASPHPGRQNLARGASCLPAWTARVRAAWVPRERALSCPPGSPLTLLPSRGHPCAVGP